MSHREETISHADAELRRSIRDLKSFDARLLQLERIFTSPKRQVVTKAVIETPGVFINDTSAVHFNVDGEIDAIEEKTVIVDEDLLLLEDSEDSNSKKKMQVSNIVDSLSAEIEAIITHITKYTDAEALIQAQTLDHDHATPIGVHAGAGDPHGDRDYSDGLSHTDIAWNGSTVSQAEAEAGTATTDRKWTAVRVKQAIAALASGGVVELYPMMLVPYQGATYSALGGSAIIGGVYLPSADNNAGVHAHFKIPAAWGTSLTINIVVGFSSVNSYIFSGIAGYENYDLGEARTSSGNPNSAAMDFANATSNNYVAGRMTRDITSISKEFIDVYYESDAVNPSYIHVMGIYLTET